MLPRGRETWRRDPRMGVLVIVAGAGLLAFLALAAAVILAPAFIRADVAVSAAIRSIELPGLTGAATAASWVGDFWPMAVLTLVVAAAFALQGRRTTALMLIVAVLGAAGLGSLVKLVFMRARPAVHALIEMPESYSFPSGHAITSFAFFATLAFLAVLHRSSLRRALVYVSCCAVAAAAIALSRVYLGVHYFADVVGSWLLGSAWLAFVVLLFARWGTGTSDEDPPTRAS
mgnify:FL=1